MTKKYILSIMMLLILNIPLYSQDKAGVKNNNRRDPTITIGNTVLTLEQAIDIVIQQNLTLQSAKYDVVMSDTAYERAQKKYSTNLNIDGGYAYQEFPPSGLTSITGNKQYQYDAGVSLSKLFSTGTTIAAGVREIFFDANDKPFLPNSSAEPASHRPELFVSIQQELLRNAFGYADRKLNKILDNSTKIQRAAIINQLSGLVVSALVDYWNVTVQKSSMESALAELDSNIKVRNIITRNANFGLAERYDINQYNALVASAEANFAAAQQRYNEAVRKLLRTVNMPPETKITGVTNLVDTLPELNPEGALKTGFQKRVDYKNALLAYENAKLNLDMQKNQALPSVTASAGITTLGQDTNMGKAFDQASTGDYPAWQVRGKITYPLDDRDLKANVRNAYFGVKQADINVRNAKLEVRDDILNRLEQVKTLHDVLIKMQTVQRESEKYYQSILRRFEQGKVNSVTMKLATDSMVQARQRQLEALVQYNVSVLLFDLSKNEIFERYNVDVEKYLSSIKVKE